MELATIGLLSAIVFGLIAGDAVISANTMAVGIGLPPAVQQSGLTRQSAEEIFVTELSRIAAIPSGVPVPVPRVSSRRTVIGALAEPLKLTDVTIALQDLFGLEPIRVSATVIQRGDGLVMETILAQQGRPLQRLSFERPDSDAVALIRHAAISTFAEIAPFRVTLARLRDLLQDPAIDVAPIRAQAERMLRREWGPDTDIERSALHSLVSVLALLHGDVAGARAEIARADAFQDALATARPFYALNAAFIAVQQGDQRLAERELARAAQVPMRQIIPSFPAYLEVQRGLIDWADGKVDAADAAFRRALEVDPRNLAAQIYRHWIARGRDGAPPNAADRPPVLTSVSPQIPGLMASVFLLDPRDRTLSRAR
ncbi:hypothetical protein GXW78_07185 [Roseomonas terrae]|uniref:Tetratricopeptide repeat protein n=1 Tax=Neoroseomonas terrae TaxID=424799 RepID=A0ABS5EEJ1_9PROT|nr:hypothetical protein [Neoroseomonas terrae]MBR0649441.1 hypothetical protein [Neoroseomonas terrae]